MALDKKLRCHKDRHMSAVDFTGITKPSTLTGIKSVAKKIKNRDGITHRDALNATARYIGYPNYEIARMVMRIREEPVRFIPQTRPELLKIVESVSGALKLNYNEATALVASKLPPGHYDSLMSRPYE